MSEFTKKIGNIGSTTAVGFALSISKELGLLEVLVDADQPLTSQQVADKKHLKERYVRELLNALATAEIIHVAANESGTLVYHISEEEKAAFKGSLLALISFPLLMATIYDQVKKCFPVDGPFGTRYTNAAYDMIEEFSIHEVDNHAKRILSNADGLKEKLENGLQAIEFGCGRGHLVSTFAKLFPKSVFVASEIVPSLLEKMKSDMGHIPNIQYELYDLCGLPDQPAKKYDWVYCVNVIHDLPHPLEALKGIRKLVKEPDGVFTMLEVSTTGSPIEDRGDAQVAFFYLASTFLCIPESYQREDSEALGACWGKPTATKLATEAGFSVQVVDVENRMSLYVCKPVV